MSETNSSRRRFLCGAVTSLSAMSLYQAAPRWAHAQGTTGGVASNQPVALRIDQRPFSFNGNSKRNRGPKGGDENVGSFVLLEVRGPS